MTPPSASSEAPKPTLQTVLLLGGVFLFALNLRPAITTVGPVLTSIGETYGLRESLLGLLGALPLIMFGLMALAVSTLANRIGVDRVVLIVLIGIAVGITVRSLLGLPGLWVGTVIATGAVAVGNVLGTVLVRRDFAGNTALATGVLSAVMGVGASTASALSPVLAERWGWQLSLLVWAVPAMLVAVLWAPRAFRPEGAVSTVAVVTSSLVPVWQRPSAWWLTIYMGLQSSTFFFIITWLPTISMTRGASTEAAGLHLFWYQIVGLCAGFIVPMLMRGRTHHVVALLAASTPLCAGFIGLLALPGPLLLWATMLGLGSGMSLVVSLTLIAQRGGSPSETAKLSGMVQSGGYFMAALAPFLAGVIIQLSGVYQWALVMMTAITLSQVLVALRVARAPKKHH